MDAFNAPLVSCRGLLTSLMETPGMKGRSLYCTLLFAETGGLWALSMGGPLNKKFFYVSERSFEQSQSGDWNYGVQWEEKLAHPSVTWRHTSCIRHGYVFYLEKWFFHEISLTPHRTHQKLLVSPANAFYDASSCNDKCKQVFSSNPESAFSAWSGIKVCLLPASNTRFMTRPEQTLVENFPFAA